MDANQVDYFKVPLKAGQRVIIDCVAQRIDSRLDGALVIYDPAGREVARVRDTEGKDPMVDFAAPAEGEYRVGLYDFIYRGGADYFYRLAIHLGPHIDFVFPPAGTAGSNDTYTVYGRNLPGGQPADGLAVDGSTLQKLPVQIPLPADDAAQRELEVAGFISSTSAVLDGLAYRLGNSNAVIIGDHGLSDTVGWRFISVLAVRHE